MLNTQPIEGPIFNMNCMGISNMELYINGIALAIPNGPTESQESRREAKVTPRRAPWKPKAPKRRPKVAPRKAK